MASGGRTATSRSSVNWRVVRDGYAPGSSGYDWFTEVYECGNRREWSRYATDLYTQLGLRAEAEDWTAKLKYLLYEGGIVSEDARAYCSMTGLMLQSPADPEGFSKNQHIRAVQESIKGPSGWDRVASDHSVLEDDDDSEEEYEDDEPDGGDRHED